MPAADETTPAATDRAKVEAFLNKALNDTNGLLVTVMATIGDRLGLFKDLAAHGPATSTELAARTAINERYAREWLGAMASAGYLAYNPMSQRFTLPPEHVPILAQEAGPYFYGGIHQMLMGMVKPLDQLLHAFRQGGGVPQAAYDGSTWEGMERFSASWVENRLLRQWIPAIPELPDRLERGIRVADVGCGGGRALIKMAQAYPHSRYIGYDVFAPTIAQATANAQAAGVTDRVRFQQLNVAEGLPERYDLITTFDVVHDAVKPRELLRAIRQALALDGIYLCLDVKCADKIEENTGPISTFFSCVSVLYCVPTSLAGGGEALGALGLPESKLRALCLEAGFSSVHRLPLKNPFNNLYVVRP